MMASAKKIEKVAYILRHSPYGSDFSHDALDAVLAGGLYGQNVSLFFMGDGVFQLLDQTLAIEAKGRSLPKKLKALSLYDIDTIYVCSDSLTARGIEPKQLCIDARLLDKQAIDNAIRDNSAILSF